MPTPHEIQSTLESEAFVQYKGFRKGTEYQTAHDASQQERIDTSHPLESFVAKSLARIDKLAAKATAGKSAEKDQKTITPGSTADDTANFLSWWAETNILLNMGTTEGTTLLEKAKSLVGNLFTKKLSTEQLRRIKDSFIQAELVADKIYYTTAKATEQVAVQETIKEIRVAREVITRKLMIR